MRSDIPPIPDPGREPDTVAAQLLAALAGGQGSPTAILGEHAPLSGWSPRELDGLMRAFDAAEATERLPEPVLATVRAALQRWSRDARNGATDQLPALPDAADWTEEMAGPDAGEDTSEIEASATTVAPRLPPAPAPLPVVPAAPTVVEPGAVLVGRYELLRQLGRGGTGVVHLARDRRRDSTEDRDSFVAIKSPRPGGADAARAIARLKREFRQTRTLSHPHIVRMHDLDRDGENWFITMEWLDGESLVQLIQRDAPLPPERALRIARACAEALAFAHGRGIVHGDFKPSNVMIDAHDDVRLLDFGAAPDSSGGEDAGPGEDLRCFATRCYASPETLAGETPTPRDDVFSLACVVYELLAGTHPFQRRGADEARAAGAAVMPLAVLSREQNEVLARGLAWRRNERPFGALELLDALQAAAGAAAEPAAEAVAAAPAVEASLTAPAAVATTQPDGRPATPPGSAFASASATILPTTAPAADEPPPRARPAARAPAATSRDEPPFPALMIALAAMLGVGFLLFLPARKPPPAPSVPAPSPIARPIAPMARQPAPATNRESAEPPIAVPRPAAAETSVQPATRIGFDTAGIKVDESAFAAVLTLRRSGNTGTRATVKWRITGASARAGEDFAGPVSGSERFAARQTLRTLYVPLLDDRDREGPETFSVQLLPQGDVGSGAVLRTTVTIVDDD